MPNANGYQYLELKKQVALLQRNLVSAVQTISVLTLEVERLKNVLASKGGYSELTEPVQPRVHQEGGGGGGSAVPAPATEEGGGGERRGPMPTGGAVQTASRGRTLKVINN